MCERVLTVKLIRSLNEGKPVRGLTTLNNELFIRYNDTQTKDIVVYDTDTYSLQRYLQITRLGLFNDMTSCERYQCIYITDNLNNVVHRVNQLEGSQVAQWSVRDVPRGISVNSACNVLVAFCDVGKIKEYTTNGQLVREIRLPSDVVHPWHAVELVPDQFVVCHGRVNDPLHRVCIVNSTGVVERSYGGFKGSGEGQLNTPVRLSLNGFIFVADCLNRRVLMLSPKLEFVRNIVVSSPGISRLWFDEPSMRLYVAANFWENGEYKSGQIHVYGF